MIAVFGSINLDLVARVPRMPKPGATVAGTAFAMFAGGKGANQALAARRAGAQPALPLQPGIAELPDAIERSGGRATGDAALNAAVDHAAGFSAPRAGARTRTGTPPRRPRR